MKAVLLAFAVTAINLMAFAQGNQWELDQSHTAIGFKGTHMVIAKVTGQFTDYEATVISEKADFSDLKVNFTAKVASINTGLEMRDNHLKSDDFFNADKYPDLVFTSTLMKKVGEGKYNMTGDLTIRDVAKSITLDVEHGGTIKDPYGKTRAGFEITGSLNRFDYGLKWNAAIEAGGLVVGEKIDIICDVEIMK